MTSVECPSCGAPMKFRFQSTLFQVCAFCKKSAVRSGADIRLFGEIAEVPQDMSVIQLGTNGQIKDGPFEVIGRVRQSWERSTWNEWFCFLQGRQAWLTDAQGFYAMSFPDDPISQADAEILEIGGMIKLKGKDFLVEDIKSIQCKAAEGELPFPPPIGRVSISIDLIGAEKAFASIDVSSEGVMTFIGSYYEFEELKLSNLKTLPGW